jgi:hypothetical protein
MATPHGLAVPNIKDVQVGGGVGVWVGGWVGGAAATCAQPLPWHAGCAPCALAPCFLYIRKDVSIVLGTARDRAVPLPALQDKTVLELAGELARLQAAAAANRLSPEDVAGGTFSISNIGAIGGTYATPLVNPPEASGEGVLATGGWRGRRLLPPRATAAGWDATGWQPRLPPLPSCGSRCACWDPPPALSTHSI